MVNGERHTLVMDRRVSRCFQGTCGQREGNEHYHRHEGRDKRSRVYTCQMESTKHAKARPITGTSAAARLSLGQQGRGLRLTYFTKCSLHCMTTSHFQGMDSASWANTAEFKGWWYNNNTIKKKTWIGNLLITDTNSDRWMDGENLVSKWQKKKKNRPMWWCRRMKAVIKQAKHKHPPPQQHGTHLFQPQSNAARRHEENDTAWEG